MIVDRRRMVAKLASAIQRLNLIVAADWVKRVDAWRRQQPSLPSRSEAIRQLVERGLDAEAKAKPKPKGPQG
jgi:metal-responsive CopG/Arc/MetJ family transcriptional regulator